MGSESGPEVWSCGSAIYDRTPKFPTAGRGKLEFIHHPSPVYKATMGEVK